MGGRGPQASLVRCFCIAVCACHIPSSSSDLREPFMQEHHQEPLSHFRNMCGQNTRHNIPMLLQYRQFERLLRLSVHSMGLRWSPSTTGMRERLGCGCRRTSASQYLQRGILRAHLLSQFDAAAARAISRFPTFLSRIGHDSG